MHVSTLLLGAATGLAPLAHAIYQVQDDYSGNNFFDMFSFDTEDDPTHGYVNYVDRGTAQSQGLIGVSNNVVTIRSDSSNIASGRGRNSVRLTSTKAYTHGLVAIDLAHMPGPACGIWPAFWMTGPNWPNSGEIDIIEGVNFNGVNQATLHTGPGCSMVGQNCQGNQGCGVQAGGDGSYGQSFNERGGGVYVMEWTTQNINIWFFNRGEIPGDLTAGNPNPLNWKWPTVQFLGGDNCQVDDHFRDNNIVFDTTFCGDWAGGVFSQTPQCSSQGSCADFVRNNPGAFTEAYWTINSLKVFSWNANARTDIDVAAAKTYNETVAAPASAAAASPSAVSPDATKPTPVPVPAAAASPQESPKVVKQQPGDFASKDGGKTWFEVQKREPHRGLAQLPQEEKVVLHGEGAGKDIAKTNQEGVLAGGVKGRVRRHLSHLHGHKRGGVDW